MTTSITSITIKTSQLESMRRFYEILGVEFQMIQVDKGGRLLRGQLSALTLNLLEASAGNAAPSPQLQFSVSVSKDLQQICQELQDQGFQLILDPQKTLLGFQAIALDPDQHAVEILTI